MKLLRINTDLEDLFISISKSKDINMVRETDCGQMGYTFNTTPEEMSFKEYQKLKDKCKELVVDALSVYYAIEYDINIDKAERSLAEYLDTHNTLHVKGFLSFRLLRKRAI